MAKATKNIVHTSWQCIMGFTYIVHLGNTVTVVGGIIHEPKASKLYLGQCLGKLADSASR